MTKRALNPITAATVIFILYMIMPILSIIISTYITTYAYMLLTVFLMLFIMLTGGIKRLTSMLYVLAPAIIYVVCTLATRTSSVLIWGYQSLLFILPVITGFYFFYYRPENINIFAKIIIVALIITSVTTIVGLIQFPAASRALASTGASDDANAVKYWWYNMGGYSFVYIPVLLYPILMLSYKLGKIRPWVFWAGVVLLFTLLILSEYTTALILTMLTSLLYFMSKRAGTKRLMIIGILFFLALFFLWPLFSRFLLWLADILRSDALSLRITALANGFEGLQSSDDKRIELYMRSISGFLRSPFFGKMMGAKTTAGGHSFILDTLSHYGIIGGASIALIYRNVYRYFFKPFSNKIGYGFILWSFVQAIILSAVNTGMWLNVLALFTPVLLYYIYNANGEANNEDSLGS